ncbi:MAG TPA: endo alpha-1,4 polygalactosaminidase [Gammaproteobacteria bacterium]|nr:endo alpha-1,4 polygalactosaminidase [Gammaproteobacteria bacterium]
MPGHPFDQPLAWEALRVADDAACASGCAPAEAEAAGVFHSQGWRYEGSGYVELAGRLLQPWDGFWAATLSGAGADTRLLTPRPSPSWWRPAPGTSWQWQLSGAVDTAYDVAMYDIDLTETPQAVIDELHAAGRKVICYYSAGSWENYRDDADQFPASVLGNTLDGWPDEKWLDIRRLDVLAPIMRARLDLAASKGCDGVEPDNVDGYANDTGFPLTRDDQLAYNRWTASEAHARGLSVGLKNALNLIPDLVADYDWALNEQCFQYDECDLLTPFVTAGKAVFGVEYQGSVESFCPRANALNFDWLKKRLDLDAWRLSCR